MRGNNLGKYRLLRHLATGGMAEIWLAECEPDAAQRRAGLDKVIAVIKVIVPERARDRTFVQMFLDEARVAGTLNHPNIAQLYEVGRDHDTYFHAIEYVHGHNARAMVERSLFQRVPVPLAVTVGVGISVSAALHHAHERKGTTGEALDIVHRDVTPSNIMIGWDGVVKLVDFGVALASRRAAETRTGVVKGKLAYMSPEQCRGRKVDRRADVFALGVTLYELSTQRRAFRAGSEYQTMERIVRGDLARPTSLVKDYPPALEEILLRALATDVDKRYQTAAELGAALDGFRRDQGLEDSRAATARFLLQLFGAPRTPQEDAAEAAAAQARLDAADERGDAPAQPVSDAGILGTGEPSVTADTVERSDEAPAAAPASPIAALAAAAHHAPARDLVPVPTGPMPIVPAPGVTAMSVASATVERVRPPGARRARGLIGAALAGVAVIAAVGLVVVLGAGRNAAGLAGKLPGPEAGTGAETVPPGEPVVSAAPAAAPPIVEAPMPAPPPPAPVEPATVTIHVVSRPAGAIVTVDGVEHGPTPATLHLPRNPGRAALELRHSGHRTLRKRVDLQRDLELDLTLERRGNREKPSEAAPPPPATEPAPSGNMADDRY